MGDVWIGAIATGIGALVVGAMLHLLKEGGVRRARRRNIREELELLKLLDEHPATAARIRKRVKVMLEQYEPSEERVETRRQRIKILLEGIGLMLVAGVCVIVFDVTSPLGIVALGLAFGTGSNLVQLLLERRRDRAEQDEAVHANVDAVVARVTVTAEGRVDGPADGQDA